MEGRIDPITSLVVSTFFAAPVFELRERAGRLAAALQTEFSDLGFQVSELVFRLDSPKPAEWWVSCPFLFQRALLWIGIQNAQITVWNPGKDDEKLVAELWSRLETAVVRGLAPVEPARREMGFHGHFPAPPERFKAESGAVGSADLGQVSFTGRLIHLDMPAGGQGRVLLDRSAELADALYLWAHSRWPAEAPTAGEAVSLFSELARKAMVWANLGAGDEKQHG